MAERTSTRTGSRRSTPQSAPQIAREGTQTPPKRTTRITRSQSHDVSDNEDGKTGLRVRRGAKHATQDGTNGAVRQSGLKSRKGRPANNSGTQQGRRLHKTAQRSGPRNPGPFLHEHDPIDHLQKPATCLRRAARVLAPIKN